MPSINWVYCIWLFLSAAGKEAPVVTPLMMYVRQQRATKSMAQVHDSLTDNIGLFLIDR